MTAHLSGPVAVIRANMGDLRPVKRALPLKLWLALEDDVIRHKAEIAQGFAEARVRLLLSGPVPNPIPWNALRPGDRVTFGFEPWRPWYARLWRRIRIALGYTYPPQVWNVTSVTDGCVTIQG